jgi:5-formyltetrahydrofolate cyclo-ligase
MDLSDQGRQGLRAKMAEHRRQMSLQQVQTYSGQIAAKLMALTPLLKAQTIMGFISIDNEVDLRPLLNQLLGQGKTILLPRVEKDGSLAAVEFKGWQDTRAGAFGIPEPIGEKTSLENIDMVIVPGLVFDGHGYRLGYGKGYYDRFLRLLPATTFACGVCYEFQIVDDVDPHGGDMPVHWIVTEKSELVLNWDFF